MLENKNETKSVVITGAAGFIGSSTVEYYLLRGWRVLALDINEANLSVREDSKLRKNFTYIKWNLFERDPLPDEIMEQHWDVFIHFAWAGSAGPQRTDLSLQIKNAEAAEACVRLAKDLRCKKFIGAGSLMEYEVEHATHNAPKITTPNHYGYGKLLAHYLCKMEASNVGIDFVWGIITNVYGPREKAPRFINTTIRKIINNEPITFSSGLQNYDFVYITDAAQAFYCMGEWGVNNTEYVVGSGDAHRLSSFIMLMYEACGSELNPQFDMSKRVDCELPIETFSIKELALDTGYSPHTSFISGIKATKEWIEKNGKV